MSGVKWKRTPPEKKLRTLTSKLENAAERLNDMTNGRSAILGPVRDALKIAEGRVARLENSEIDRAACCLKNEEAASAARLIIGRIIDDGTLSRASKAAAKKWLREMTP